jgi:hypothetical protein
MQPEDFAHLEPRLELERYFLGKTQAFGLFHDRFGRLRRQFVVEIEGRIEDGVLVLDEHFRYDDGESDRRVWRIRRIDEHRYEGTADDVIGVARGRAFGNAMHWSYQVDLPIGDSSVRVTFDDWLYLLSDAVLLNRAEVSKFGIRLGEVMLAFVKERATPALSDLAVQKPAAAAP